MNPIDQLFQDLRAAGRKAFIPFLTAGDPSLVGTSVLLKEVVRCGADLVEIGFPYSDPIADGAVIQASYTRALDKGLRLNHIIDHFRDSRPHSAPLVAMVSYSLIHRRGPEGFLDRAIDAGFSGAVVPDLPIEESAPLLAAAKGRDFRVVQLITPTTPRDRAVLIARQSTGFIYYVSVTGITGTRAQLPAELLDQLRWLRGQTELPICVGFGISTTEHARMLRDVADGIIVGSAIVRRIEHASDRPPAEIAAEVGTFVQGFRNALDE